MNINEQIDFSKSGIIITTNENKYNLMRKLNEVEQLVQLPIFTLSEINSILNGQFNEEALIETVKYFATHEGVDLNLAVAKKYLQTCLELDTNVEYEEELLCQLKQLKNHLIKLGLFEYKPLRLNLIKNKQVYLYDVVIDQLLKEQIEKTSAMPIITIQYNDYQNCVYYEFNTINEEVEFVATQIAKLVNAGVSGEKILLHVPQSEYHNVIAMIFSQYNIKHDIIHTRTLASYPFVLELIKQIEINGLEYLKQLEALSELEVELVNQLITLINKYPTIHDDMKLLIKLLKYDIEKTTVKSPRFKNVVRMINLEKYYPSDDEYVFCLNFAESRVPKVIKDNKIISDPLAIKYEMKTTQELNTLNKQMIVDKIKGIKNITLSYARNSISGEEAKSSLLTRLDLKASNVTSSSVHYSKKHDLVNYAKAKELELKYDSKHENLIKLGRFGQIETYKNQINSELYQEFNQETVLSATSIQKFFECEFKFYLNKMLKVNVPISNTKMIDIGNLYHYVLEMAQTNNVSTQEEVSAIINDYLIEERVVNPMAFKTASDEFYLKQYSKYLHQIVSVIYDFHKRSEFKLSNAEFEREFRYTLDQELNIQLMGKVDKYVELDLNNKFYVVIIDYKTKNKPQINHTNFSDGFELQNFIYLNLIKASQGDDEIELIGTYQQRVKPQHLYGHEDFADDFKLFGYTSSNQNVIRQLEPEYQDNQLSQLANLKLKKSGDEFDRFSKVFDEEDLANFEKIVQEKLSEVVSRIKKANYQINPKLKKGENKSCTYCDYRAICYRQNNNFVNLEEQND